MAGPREQQLQEWTGLLAPPLPASDDVLAAPDPKLAEQVDLDIAQLSAPFAHTLSDYYIPLLSGEQF